MASKSKSRALMAGITFSIVSAAVCALAFYIPSLKRSYDPFQISRDYAFIAYEKNHIDLYGAPDRWHRLLSKFDTLAFQGRGKINIVHIGGSHVQGGFLTDQLRQNFIDLFYGAGGERGFLFPYQLAKTNAQRSVKCSYTGKWEGCRNAVSDHSCSWGMSGINAHTTDSDAGFTLHVLNKDSTTQTFSEVKIYSSAGKEWSFDYTINGAQLDSMTIGQSYRRYIFQEAQEKLDLQLFKNDSGQTAFDLQGIYIGHSPTGVSYHTIGVNGASTKSYLRCVDFGPQVQSLAADLVICGIGVNDANVPADEFDALLYQARYDSLIYQFKSANPNVCFLFVTNNDTYYQKSYSNPNAFKIRESMIALAQKHDGAVYDLFGIMGGPNSIRSWANEGLAANDYIHFSKRGYELQAHMMTAAFAELLGNYLASQTH
jgi:lysophospholipase L1-like esterase